MITMWYNVGENMIVQNLFMYDLVAAYLKNNMYLSWFTVFAYSILVGTSE